MVETNPAVANATLTLPQLPSYTLSPLPPLINGIPDSHLALALPVVAYWLVSLIFHCIDEWDLFPQYRLHTPAEVLKRNHVSRWDVLKDVIIQQVIQTIVGLCLGIVDPVAMMGMDDYNVSVWAQRIRIVEGWVPHLLGLAGLNANGIARSLDKTHFGMLSGALAGGVYPQLTRTVFLDGHYITAPTFADWEMVAAKTIYHVVCPALQFLLAILVVDTWQYFLHRAMHMNKWLYTTFHSRHHRLYVPYAYGALYNHPFEGFLLDSLGTGIAYLVSGMTVRQSMWFFTLATIKTVDDHCGYAFPWDPLQHLTGNNAGYHDVHHQSWGVKTNFSQPFFTFWDAVLGTKWTGGDVSARYEKAKLAAQRKVEAESAPVSDKSSAPTKAASSPKPYEQDMTNASSTARCAQAVLEPRIPNGKAAYQAIGSRQQVLDAAGVQPLAAEATEEVQVQKELSRNTKKRSRSLGLKGFADRVGESLRGKGTGVLGMENGPR